jgi:hypothetical protein
MTCVAVIVVPLVVPSTTTDSPIVTALAEVGVVSFWYAVEDASLTVTFSPADVEMVKLDADTPSTVPAAPPAAGPDRAFEPPPPDSDPPAPPPGARCPDAAEEAVAVADEAVAVGEEAVAVGEEDAQPAESPITADISAAAMIPPLPLFDRNRRTLGRRASWAVVARAERSGEESGEGSGAEPVSSKISATDSPGVALISSGLVGS